MLYQRNKPFRVPLQVRLSYMLVSIGWLRIFPLIAAILFLVLASWGLMWLYSVLTFSTSIFKDVGFVGLFGSLFGALLGSIVGGTVSLHIQSQQSRAVATINKKEQIYEPLYNAMVSFRIDLLKYPHPHSFILDPSQHRVAYAPYFVEWAKIKDDSRFIEVPGWIKSTFDQYTNDFTHYLFVRANAIVDTENMIKGLMDKEYNLAYRSIPGSDLMMFRAILHTDRSGVKHQLETQFNHLKNDELFDKAAQSIIDKCCILPGHEQVHRIYYDTIINHTDRIITDLTNIIKYINIKYENHETAV